MSATYRAILHGDHLRWTDERPPAAEDMEVIVEIVPPRKKTNAAAAVAHLRALAAKGGIRSISDPVAWQREIREDRPLPDRE